MGAARTARFRGVTQGYFAAMGIELIRGRGISEDDQGDTPRVLVINETMARRDWPGRDPVGQGIRIGPYEFEIVGVVSDVLSLGLDREESPVLYRPLTQGASDYSTLVIRRRNPQALSSIIRDEITILAPQLTGVSIRTMRDVVNSSISPQRITVGLAAALAAASLLLAVLGVYGLARYQVTQQTAEIGVRMALGSTASQIRRSTLIRGGRVVGGGLLLGVAVALLATRVLSSLLYGVSPRDPGVFLQAGAFVSLVGLLAVYLPARRASLLDPMTALRID